MKLSVIMPVWNEAATIRQVLEAVLAVRLDKEIIVVDGQSTDGTVEILTAFADNPEVRILTQTVRNGRGGALRQGMDHATGDVVVFQDGDLELDPACFPELLQPIAEGRADIVFGSRFLRGRPRMTFLQYWGNKTVNFVLNLLWRTRLTDVETCYQMFRREAVQGMTFDRTDMSFTVELTLRLVHTGLRVAEVPVDYSPRSAADGKKLYWADGFISLYILLHYRLLWWLKPPTRPDAPSLQANPISPPAPTPEDDSTTFDEALARIATLAAQFSGNHPSDEPADSMLEEIDRALAAAGDQRDVRASRIIHALLLHPDAAEAALRHIQAAPAGPALLLDFASAAHSLGCDDLVDPLINRAAESLPENSPDLLHLQARTRNDPAESLACYQRILDLHPEDRRAWEAILSLTRVIVADALGPRQRLANPAGQSPMEHFPPPPVEMAT